MRTAIYADKNLVYGTPHIFYFIAVLLRTDFMEQHSCFPQKFRQSLDMFYKRRDPQSLLEPKTLGFIMTHTENPLVSVSICSAFSSRKDPSVHFFSAFCHFNTVPKRRAYGSIFCCE